MADPNYAASILCLNPGRLEEEFQALETAGFDELHFDVGDGVFGAQHTVGTAFVRMARACCGLPVHAHLMVTQPERHVEAYAEAGCGTITVHAEACLHGHRTLEMIRNAGASPGIAVNPATSLAKLDYLLPLADRVLLLTGTPAARAPKLAAYAAERVRILQENLGYHEYRAEIEVEGAVDSANAGKYLLFGAKRLVLDGVVLDAAGTDGYAAALSAYKKSVAIAQHVV